MNGYLEAILDGGANDEDDYTLQKKDSSVKSAHRASAVFVLDDPLLANQHVPAREPSDSRCLQAHPRVGSENRPSGCPP